MPFAFGIAALVVLSFSSCRREKEEEKKQEPEVSTTAPEYYMKKPAMTNLLATARKERGELAKLRNRLIDEVTAKVDAARAANPGKDDEAIKAILEQDAEYVSLHRKLVDVTKAIDDQRQRVGDEARRIIMEKDK